MFWSSAMTSNSSAASAFRPLSPSAAQPTRIPSRSSPRENQAAQALIIVDIEDVARHLSDRGRNLDDGEEKPELADGMGEVLVVHGLGNVDIASEIIATLDLHRIVSGGENHHRAALEVLVLFQPLENVDPAHVRQVQIKQDEQGTVFVVS